MFIRERVAPDSPSLSLLGVCYPEEIRNYNSTVDLLGWLVSAVVSVLLLSQHAMDAVGTVPYVGVKCHDSRKKDCRNNFCRVVKTCFISIRFFFFVSKKFRFFW